MCMCANIYIFCAHASQWKSWIRPCLGLGCGVGDGRGRKLCWMLPTILNTRGYSSYELYVVGPIMKPWIIGWFPMMYSSVYIYLSCYQLRDNDCVSCGESYCYALSYIYECSLNETSTVFPSVWSGPIAPAILESTSTDSSVAVPKLKSSTNLNWLCSKLNNNCGFTK